MAVITAVTLAAGLYTSSWQDISDYVIDWRVKWGRSSAFETMRPTTLTLRLLNTDRRFEPGYSSGAYYDYLKCGTLLRLRVSFTAGSTVDMDLFYGSVNSIRLQYPNKRTDTGGAYATIEASCPLAVLAKERTENTYGPDTSDAMITDIIGDLEWTNGTINTGSLADPYGADLQAVGSTSGASMLALIEQIARSAGAVFYLEPNYTEAIARLIQTRNDSFSADFTLTNTDLTDITLGLEDDQIYNQARLTGQDNDIGDATYDETDGSVEDQWTLASHGLADLQEVWFSAAGGGASGYAVDTHYWVIDCGDPDYFQLASSLANATADTPISGTGDSTGTWTLRVCGTLQTAGRAADTQWLGERVLIESDLLLYTDAEVDTRTTDELAARCEMIDALRPTRLATKLYKGLNVDPDVAYLFAFPQSFGEISFDPGTGASRTYQIKVLGGQVTGAPGKPVEVVAYTEAASQFTV